MLKRGLIMGLTKSGEIMYRSKFSMCQKCSYHIKNLKCWFYDMIPYRIWENCVGYECNKFKSFIKNHNNCYVFRDYENRDIFPEKVFGGKYKFDRDGNRIGINECVKFKSSEKINLDNPFVYYGNKK
jgi:hypothetical protein